MFVDPRQAARWLGGGLIVVAVVVPSDAWIGLLRGAPPPEGWPDALLQGARLWRLALALLGAWTCLRPALGDGARASVPTSAAAGPVSGRERLLLAGVLALGAALRFHALGAGLWYDEVETLTSYVRLPLGELVSTFDSQNQHPGFTLPAHLSVLAFGESAWSLRLPAALFGVASLWALWRVGRELFGRRDAILSAALLAVSYHHVWFSQNARGYSAALFFTLLSTWLFLRARDDERPAPWVAYAAAAALAAWSHLTAVFVTLAQLVLYLPRLLDGSRPRAARWLPVLDGFGLAALLVVALHAFGLPQLLGQALHETSEIEAWTSPLWTLREIAANLRQQGGGIVVGVGALTVLGVGIASSLRRGPELPVLLLLPALVIFGTSVAMGHHLWPRLFFVVAGFAVLSAIRGTLAIAEWGAGRIGFSRAWGHRLGTAAACLALAVSAATLPRAWLPKQDYEGARDFVEARVAEGESIVVVGLARHPYGKLYAPGWRAVEDAAGLEEVRRGSRGTWVVYTFSSHMQDEHADLLDVLRSDFETVRRFDGTVGDGAIVVMREATAQARSPSGTGG